MLLWAWGGDQVTLSGSGTTLPRSVSNYTITHLSLEQRTEFLPSSRLFEALRAYKC